MQIEDTIFTDSLPVNSIPIIERLKEVLNGNNTNSIEECKNDLQVRKLMWLLNSQFYGQFSCVDMVVEWNNLKVKELNPVR